MKRIPSKVIASILLFILAVQIPFIVHANPVKDSRRQSSTYLSGRKIKKIELSARRLVLDVGYSGRTLCLTAWYEDTHYFSNDNANLKARWKSSNKNILELAENDTEVRLIPKNIGKAVVTANYKNKNYKCVVTVQPNVKVQSGNLPQDTKQDVYIRVSSYFTGVRKHKVWDSLLEKVKINTGNGPRLVASSMTICNPVVTYVKSDTKKQYSTKVFLRMNGIPAGETHKIRWSSSNKLAATVDKNGVVTSKLQNISGGTSTTTITAIYKGKKYVCKVNVTLGLSFIV